MPFKQKIYNSNITNAGIGWDVDGSFALPLPYTREKYDYELQPAYYYNSTSKYNHIVEGFKREDFLFVLLSQKYPINTQFRESGSIFQPNIENYPNVPLPYLQFVEDITFGGTWVNKLSLPHDLGNRELSPTFYDILFDFLKQKYFFSFRDYIIFNKNFALEKPKKKIYTIDTINGYNQAINYFNYILPDNKLLDLSTQLKFQIISGTLTPSDDPLNYTDYFDYDTSQIVIGPSSGHIPYYWNPLHLSNLNLLSLYIKEHIPNLIHGRISEEISSNVFIQFNNLIPNIINYKNPLLIELRSIVNTRISYVYTDNPNISTLKTINVNNPQICFYGAKGFIKQFINSRQIKTRYFSPITKKFLTTIIFFNVDTLETTFTILGATYTTIVYNTNIDSVNKEGIILIDNSLTKLYFLE